MEATSVMEERLGVLDYLDVGRIAGIIGAQESGLRLVLSLFFGYPLAIIHRKVLYGTNPFHQHLFFVLTGLAIGYFNYGWDVLHTVAEVVGVYVILYLMAGTMLSVTLVFLYCMGYLLWGYYWELFAPEDITWTMPQCVLTLRLIGLAFDIYDGAKPASQQSAVMKKSALTFTPSLLEVAGHTYFPSSFMIGPQFTMNRYLQLVAGNYQVGGKNIGCPGSVSLGLKKGSVGLFYLALSQIGAAYFSDSYLLSTGFKALPLYRRMLVVGLWGRFVMYKYIACWLLSEGVCVTTGLAYNGQDKKNEPMLDGCANVNLRVFENAWQFQHIIDSFNINTNDWVLQYIYKRLKWMGNRLASQSVTLLFLAIWHGLLSGFYMTFILEFIIMYQEKDFTAILEKNKPVYDFVNRPYIRPVLILLLKIYVTVFLGYCLVPFVMHPYHLWLPVYQSVHFYGYVLFVLWPLYSFVLKWLLRPKVSTDVNVKKSSESLHTKVE